MRPFLLVRNMRRKEPIPHLWLERGHWRCHGDGFTKLGFTPAMAYSVWSAARVRRHKKKDAA